MKKIDKYLQKAEQQCQQKGSRLTPKRIQILSTLLFANKAISAYELIDLYESRFEKTIPAMSVYRILAYLEDMHLVHKIKIANKYVACTNISGNGDHVLSQFLFCEQCQSVEQTPVPISIYNALLDRVKQSGYQLCSEQLELSCLCNNCANPNNLLSNDKPLSTEKTI